MTAILDTIFQRSKIIVIVIIAALTAGVYSYKYIPREAEPNIDVPVYYISVSLQGISPKDAVRLLVKPLETQLRGLEDLEEIISVASTGHASIILKFDINADKNIILNNIRDKVGKARTDMPEEASNPSISETNLALQPTIIVALSGGTPERILNHYARELQYQIETIPSVQKASLSGNRQEVLEVLLDLQKLESYNITQNDLISAFQQNNRLIPAGFLDDGNTRFNLKISGLVEKKSDVDSIPIKQSGESVVTLGEVAQIRKTFKENSSYTRVNGKPAISIDVVKRIGTNLIENNNAVRKIVKDFTQDWPSIIKINFLIDQSSFVFEILSSLESAIITAIILVMIVVVAFLGLRSGLLIGLAIPISFMVGFLILYTFGITLNMMVMFAMVLTVGMLVDSAIVVAEYADRKMLEGVPPNQAYSRSAKLMFWPVFSSTATTLAAFLPLLFWPGVSGKFMSYVPLVVIVVLTASLVTALVFLPGMGIFFVKVSGVFKPIYKFPILKKFRQKYGINWKQADEKNSLSLSVETKLDIHKISGFIGLYLRFLQFAISNIGSNLIVLVKVFFIIAIVWVVFQFKNIEIDFFVDEEPSLAVVQVSARGNFSSKEILNVANEVEREILKISGIKNLVMTATVSGDKNSQDDTIATMQIELADYCCRRKAVDIFSEIRSRTKNIPGIKVEISKIEGGPPTGKDINLQVKSTDYNLLVKAVRKIRAYLDNVENLQDLEDDLPLPGIDWEISVDREQAGRYNASIALVGSAIQMITNGLLIDKYHPDDSEEEIEIRVRLPEDQRTLSNLKKLRLTTSNGQVPIANFIKIKPKSEVASITRIGGTYVMNLKANLVRNATVNGKLVTRDNKVDEITNWLNSQQWPSAVSFEYRGTDEEKAKAQSFLVKAAIGSLFLMFFILLIQFNSFYQAILTLLTIVLAVIGVLIGIIVTGQKFSTIMTGTGIIALSGIVVNNAIVLLETYNRMRIENINIYQAILKTSAQRLRPIMLTTATTVLGLLPMALAININFLDKTISIGTITSAWWVQFSTAIIFGLLFSTILTLVVIPVMLSLPANLLKILKYSKKNTVS